MEQNIVEKTGKTLEEWKVYLQGLGFSKHGQIMAHLKDECGISHGYANLITLKYREADAASSSEQTLLAQQYKGKESLIPIYEKLKQHILAISESIQVSPKKAAVSFRSKRQFALIQPSTKTRIDLGLKFNNRATEGRLESSGPFGSMCSHRVQITALSQVDDELVALLRDAYLEAS